MSDTATPEDIALYLEFKTDLEKLGSPSDFENPIQKVMELALTPKYKALTERTDTSPIFAVSLLRGLHDHFEGDGVQQIALQTGTIKMAAQAHGWNQTSLDYTAIGIMVAEKIDPTNHSEREGGIFSHPPDPAFEQDLVTVLDVIYNALADAFVACPAWSGPGEEGFGGNEEFSKYVDVELQKRYGAEFNLNEVIEKAIEEVEDE